MGGRERFYGKSGNDIEPHKRNVDWLVEARTREERRKAIPSRVTSNDRVRNEREAEGFEKPNLGTGGMNKSNAFKVSERSRSK